MLSSLVSLFIGDKASRTFKKHKATIERINRLFDQYDSLSDEELRAKTAEFKQRVADGETLDQILPEAFAAVKQACKRLKGQSWEAAGNIITWDIVPFDVQLAGGIELHSGNIAEMATGEGKTLVAVAPLYLNALAGQGAHLITVNDYLAKRDSQWMGKVYEFLGLTVGCILTDMRPAERRVAYGSDITYGTNNEFGFDYLRDNMAHSMEHLVQRGHFYAIVDEVDSVLIDEARTPLIISGEVDRDIQQFDELKPVVAELVRKQSFLVNKLVSEAEELLAQADKDEKKKEDLTYEAGIKLLQARKGYPKHRRLSKVMGEAPMQRLVERVEHDFMMDKRVAELEEELFFVVDERGHSIDTTQKGREALSPSDPDLYMIPDLVEALAEIEGNRELSKEDRDKLREAAMAEQERKTETIHSLSQLLRAYVLYEKDDEYVIQDNKIVIVDEFTGRLMAGRRWSDGLHQAVEAKEGVKVEKETQTLATITLQNYFRMYKKLAGMTGTAETEASEFAHTYKMNVAVIPTNRPIRRYDDNDLIYKTQREKFSAVVEHVTEVNKSGMPLLIGTVSVDVSEKLSRILKRAGIEHNVLNAKQHQREAEIVREAGKLGAVTIATNMAGRGTDIKLGPGVIRCKSEGFAGPCCPICPNKDQHGGKVDDDLMPCGLHIVGTERHEARRIDRQLRGRSGRQGDPGYSIFFVSLEDELMRLFASDRMARLMAKGFEEGEAMSHGIATRAITSAQKKIEDINFERRKRTLEYDNVMNKQRVAIYGFRRGILSGQGAMTDTVMEVAREAVSAEWDAMTEAHDDLTNADVKGFVDWVLRHVPLFDAEGITYPINHEESDEFLEEIERRIANAYTEKIKIFGEGLAGALSRWVLLDVIDRHWRDNLLAIDSLREGIGLVGYGQMDPLTEYQKRATLMFMEMMYNIHKECFEHVFRATIVQSPQEQTSHVTYQKAEATAVTTQPEPPPSDGETSPRENGAGQAAPPPPPKVATYRRDTSKIGRNDPCPCGSGKKFKSCCGAPGARPRPGM